MTISTVAKKIRETAGRRSLRRGNLPYNLIVCPQRGRDGEINPSNGCRFFSFFFFFYSLGPYASSR